ncbi:HPP family protein [Desulfosporosinus metallidurans]|uniref:CBS-domain-containing membrane protein n=1 Tax=Desulfosporosinus metallidurans TaxID=1888891 RepID=A0A1Q8QK44_9FIRM|nr:HPP family protein [Desulfosporosinus metallidurans]OLN27690.1 CBS-domain-containing membrane protein [Desulfosporosinus metallidurans]
MQEVKESEKVGYPSDSVNTTALIRKEPSLFINYIFKMKGYKRTTPLVSPAPLDVIITWFGAFLGMTAIVLFSHQFELPIVASFGASAVLIYGVPDAPLSQPRNVIFGHTLSAAVGVATYMMFGLTWWSPALGTALALVVIILTKTTHPPGGATALFAVLSKAHPSYILFPIATGAVILVIVGLLVNNLSPNRHYPRYWL